jgi:hypothetical protein
MLDEIPRLNFRICKLAPIEVTPEVLAHHILPLLPQDGTPVLNRVMRVMLSRQLEIQIEPELSPSSSSGLSCCSLNQSSDLLGRLFWSEYAGDEQPGIRVIYSQEFHGRHGRFTSKLEIFLTMPGYALTPIQHIKIRGIHRFEMVSEFHNAQRARWGSV